jgi:hypothetical protein
MDTVRKIGKTAIDKIRDAKPFRELIDYHKGGGILNDD